MDINTVTLTGRLGRDIELRQTAKGTSVANVSLAVESGFGDNRKTNWIGLDFWGKAAESAAQYLGKGRKVAVSGRLDQSDYEKDGKTVTKTRVVVENWTFADSDGRREAGGTERREEPRQRPERDESIGGRGNQEPAGGSDGDDDIPF